MSQHRRVVPRAFGFRRFPRTRDVLRQDWSILARGIYPQLLAERGLVAALAAAARRWTVPSTVLAEPLERQSQEVESAFY